MGILILSFILLVFFTSSTLRAKFSDLEDFKNQLQLLLFTIELHDITHQLYLDADSHAQPIASESLKSILQFQKNSDAQLKKLSKIKAYSTEQIQWVSEQLDQTNAPISEQRHHEKLRQLQDSTINAHNKLIELLINTHPQDKLLNAKTISESTQLYYKQKHIVSHSLFTKVNLRLLFELLDLVKKEQSLNQRFATSSDNRQFSSVERVEQLIEKQQLLSDLDKQLGYDGFIHHFKNLVIRGPENYETSTRQKLLKTVRLIDTLSNQHELNAESRLELITIREVILEYANKLETVIEEWNKNTSVNAIDALVKIDDEKAAVALKMLNKDIYQVGLTSLSMGVDTHIDATYNATTETYSLLKHLFAEELGAIKRSMILYLSVSISGSIILLIVITYITQRLISRIEHLKKVLHHMETYTDLNIRANEDSNDEIGDIARSLNKAIVHRIEIEKSLEDQTLKAKQAAQAKTRFLAGMSHEMKTPLNSIIGYSQRLLAKHSSPDSREYEAIETINKNGQRLLNRILHILKLVDIENTQDAIKQATNITHLQQAIQTHTSLIEADRINIQWNINDSQANLVGSTEWISDIVKHLCALNNFPQEATINIIVLEKDDHCIISVSFNNPETSLEEIESLFNEADGLVNPNSKSYEGSNLNLAITKSMVERISGSINALFNEGAVTYQLNLPLHWDYSI